MAEKDSKGGKGKEEEEASGESKQPNMIKLIMIMFIAFTVIMLISVGVMIAVLKDDKSDSDGGEHTTKSAKKDSKEEKKKSNKKEKEESHDEAKDESEHESKEEAKDESSHEPKEEAKDESSHEGGDKKGKKSKSNKAIFFSIRPAFTVNFQKYKRAKFLQISVDLMGRDQKLMDQMKDYIPLIKNDLVALFSAQSDEELSTPEGKEKMRLEALKIVQDILQKETGKPGIENLLFTSFVMQ